MKSAKKVSVPAAAGERKSIRMDGVEASESLPEGPFDEKEIERRAAYFLLNGMPPLVVNALGEDRYRLLSGAADYFAAKRAGDCRGACDRLSVFRPRSGAFETVERLKEDSLGAMEAAYLMKKLLTEFGWTQDDVAAKIGKSRPAVANTLRLLTLSPEVVGLVECGRLSAGHARALVSVPQDKQYAFAKEALGRGYSVRETERAVKAFLTPPGGAAIGKGSRRGGEERAAQSVRRAYAFGFPHQSVVDRQQEKGRIYIDYYSAEDLYRFEECSI